VESLPGTAGGGNFAFRTRLAVCVVWGSEEHQRSLFARHGVSLELSRGVNPFVFPTVEEYMTFFEERYGPTIKAKARLTADGTWEACRAELRELYEELNSATDGTLHIDSEYLVTIGRVG
jgi:hypothetical protein